MCRLKAQMKRTCGTGHTKMHSIARGKIWSFALGLIMACSLMTPSPASAQAEPILGQLMMVGFNFCPRGWANADGQILAISTNTALFSLLGTMYGGDGRTTFALPDLRGRVPVHLGTGAGLSRYSQGQSGGQETVTLTAAEMPGHSHGVNATNQIANLSGPGTDFLGKEDPRGNIKQYHNGPANVQMDPNMIADSGGNQPHENRAPYLALRWCIALQGIFPSRN